MALTDFIQNLDDLGIEVVQVDASLDQETQDISSDILPRIQQQGGL